MSEKANETDVVGYEDALIAQMMQLDAVGCSPRPPNIASTILYLNSPVPSFTGFWTAYM